MFSIDLLPAGRGDGIWIEYGTDDERRRVLIDGGLKSTYRNHTRPRIENLSKNERRFELLVITHIDLDHIAGTLEMLRDPPEDVKFGDVWFNAWEHLVEDPGVLGAKQGESVSAWLKQRQYGWNGAFDGKAVVIPDDGPLPSVELKGGMTLTLLSPTRRRLNELAPVWEREIEEEGLEPGDAGWELERLAHPEDEEPEDGGVLGDDQDIEELADSFFQEDKSQANGSSIAFLAEYNGKKALFTGDAFAKDVAAAVKRLLAERDEEVLELDALKLSHHGGRKNTSRELLRLLQCKRFLFSTDGSYYKHPHRESVARALVHGVRPPKPDIVFNYRTKFTEFWDDAEMYGGAHAYDPTYPHDEGARVRL
jgi:beta-lactamase superfamily II metal-dependent hydrolase